MKKILAAIEVLQQDKRGQGMVEYALVISFVAIVVLGAVTLFGTQLSAVFTSITNAL